MKRSAVAAGELQHVSACIDVSICGGWGHGGGVSTVYAAYTSVAIVHHSELEGSFMGRQYLKRSVQESKGH